MLSQSSHRSSPQEGILNSQRVVDRLEEVCLKEELLVEVYPGEVCPEDVNLKGGFQEGVPLEEGPLEEAPLVGVGQEEVGPLEEALGPMGLGVHPKVVEVQEVLVVLVDPSPLEHCSHHASVASPPLPSSHQGPSCKGASHEGEDPSLGVPWGPSLAVAHVVPRNQVEAVHVVPRNQVVVVHGVPSLQEEDGASHLEGPSVEEGPSPVKDLWAPWEDVLDLDPSLRCAALLECEANTVCDASSAPLSC